MSALLEVTEGWTDELGPFSLFTNDTDPFDPSNYDVELILKRRSGDVVDTTGKTRNADQKVYFKPEDGDLLHKYSPYTMHWKVTDINGDVVFFPHGAPDTMIVNKA